MYWGLGYFFGSIALYIVIVTMVWLHVTKSGGNID
jgi:hypothetical protein